VQLSIEERQRREATKRDDNETQLHPFTLLVPVIGTISALLLVEPPLWRKTAADMGILFNLTSSASVGSQKSVAGEVTALPI
jgi:hypothetical protein